MDLNVRETVVIKAH